MRWVLVAAIALVCACTPAPPVTGSPWTLVPAHFGPVTKVDLVFAIDNSGSMATKRALVTSASPSLLERLVNPRCIDANAQPIPGDGQGCTTLPGTKPEFPPVRDMHVAIVSSSLGGGGSPDMCTTAREDDHGHALNRLSPTGSIANANPIAGGGGNFLAWLPDGGDPPNVTTYAGAQIIEADFQSLVDGAQSLGCDLEGQLESWYRFLIQPDPYDAIELTSENPPKAELAGVDTTLLQMRRDFLRPDSLVAILQVTDEEDSWSDPEWLGGYGWVARTNAFPGGPGSGTGPRGTSECDAPGGANNPDCTSCAFPGSSKPVSGGEIGMDPNCNACAGALTTCPQKGWYAPEQDGLGARYGSQTMRTRYGFDSQFDVRRYVDGLRSRFVPDRDHEARAGTSYETTARNCTNPLYAAALPDGTDTSAGALCDLPLGGRTPDLVFYGLIGGVSPSLVKSHLGPADWMAIVGRDPEHYDFAGIDPHMIESVTPRADLEPPPNTYDLGSDPISGREWNTHGNGLQLACTFDLAQPIDCTKLAACDCNATAATDPGSTPACDPANRSLQIKGVVYPTIRELRVAKGLGDQASIASLCATDLSPAMSAFGSRIGGMLGEGCLTAALPKDAAGNVACVMVAVFVGATDCTSIGATNATSSIVSALGDDASISTCVLDSTAWHYAEGVNGCARSIEVTDKPQNAQLVLMCTGIAE